MLSNLLTFWVLYAYLGSSICLAQGPPLGGWGWHDSLCVFECERQIENCRVGVKDTVLNVVVLLVMQNGIETPWHLKTKKMYKTILV